MKRNIFVTTALLLLASVAGKAQFVTTGTDGASIRWRSIESASWKVVYPEGADSLAREYARALEGWRQAVGGSIGIAPNGNYRRKMPVVLHTGNAISNGMVTWLPRRMELFTTPESVAPDPYPWVEQLAVHESRHVAQMQVAKDKEWGAFNGLSGEMWTGFFSALYGGPAFLEGDAVVAETALSASGRARTADFLEFMRASNLEGKHRNWWQWRYGSLSKYTPDYYKAGYALIAGMRNVYADSLFTQRFYDRIRKKWLPYNNLKNTMGAVSRHGIERTWKAIDGNLTGLWEKETAERSPYTYSELIGKKPRSFVSYSRLTAAPEGVYAVRSGIEEAAELVLLDNGKVNTVCNFSSGIGMMCYSVPAGRLYWSETIPDIRREMKSSSAIRYLDKKGIKRTLVRGRMLFNPSANPDAREIAAVEQLPDGRGRVVVFDALDGRELSSFAVPAGMQVTETVWAGGKIYASVLTENGMGIRSLPDFESVLQDSHVKIYSLSSDGGNIYFTSDRDGSNEIYSIEAGSRSAPLQLTSCTVGAKNGIMTTEGLLFTSVSTRGKLMYLTPADSLRRRPVDWNERHKWVWEDRLSGQESAIRKAEGIPEPDMEIELGEPARYSKGKHLFHVHSWLPLYVNPDEIAATSVETVSQSAWLGASAFFQNLLGTFHGTAGIQLLPSVLNDPYAGASLQMTYEGLFPVIDASLHFSERYAYEDWAVFKDGTVSPSNTSNVPAWSSRLRAYVPLSFSSGGWNRGAIASASWNVSNDLAGVLSVKPRDDEDDESPKSILPAVSDGRRRVFNRATFAARFYAMRPVPQSCVYPRIGLGLEAGCSLFPGMEDICTPVTFFSSYCYLPGITKRQGLRLSLTMEKQREGSTVKCAAGNYVPRGMDRLDGFNWFVADFPGRSKLSADYVIPFWSIESDRLCPVAYIRNMEATLHWDYSYFWGKPGKDLIPGGDVASAGADICFVLGNLAWIPYDTRIGVGWNHCWGIPGFHDSFNIILSLGL